MTAVYIHDLIGDGVVPAGSTPTATAELTLTTGVRYRVTVALVDGTSGSVDFTP